MLCCIGIGSNLGDRFKNIQKAIFYLKKTPDIKVKRASPIYETAPQGGPGGQANYFNLVVEIDSKMKPNKLLTRLKNIEKEIGRKPRAKRWAAREIDLDIILCEDIVIKEKDLKIPHPMLEKRFFVLKPLSDLVPQARHPLLGLDVKTMLASLPKPAIFKRVMEKTSYNGKKQDV